MKKNLLLTLLALVLCVFGTQATWAQGITTAFINGKVVDEKGEGIPGATVVAVHEPSGSQYATATLNDGRFNLPNVRIGGPYTITASFVGTKEQKVENLFLSLGQTYTANFELTESSTELQEVVVSGLKDPIFNSDRTGAGTNINSTQLSNMPTISRNFTDMTRLVPQSSGTSFAGRNNRYNNLTIDGSLFNNAFGLSSLPGGQTNSQPISLDALEEIQVNVAPYDVRQGVFTGAAINAVTRSGTNDFSGSAYYFTRNQSLVGQRVSGNEIPVDNFNFSQVGMRVGGPIIKNKLFFFVSGELERRNDPFGNFVANRGTDGANVSLVNGTAADALADFLRSRGYDPGPIDGYQAETGSDKLLARLDWNINNNNRLTVRYNFLQSRRDVPASASGSQGGRANSRNSLPFRNGNYIINNNYNSVVAELNSTIGNKFSNNLIIGWTGFRDFRDTPGGTYPFVDIENGNNQQAVAFGNELFSVNNLLNQDVFQFTNNFNVFLGKHTLTFGTSNEYYRFENGFMPAFHSRYRFPTLNAFYNSFPAGTVIPTGPEITVNPDGTPRLMANQSGISDGTGRPTFFEYRYSATTDEVPLARFEALQLGFYAQDEWQVADNFKLTTGVRIDVPIFTRDATPNPQANEINFLNNERFDFSKFPSAYVMFSPRIGFNWDVKNDKTIQVRGGTGVFSGRIPFVWMSNQASNTGALFGTINPGFNAAGLADFPFRENVFAYRPADAERIGVIPATYALNVTAQNFRFPQVWRSNLATDFKLPYGIVATLEAGITADLNAVYVRNANLGPAVGIVAGDGRVRYAGGAASRLNANILENIVLDNNNQGWSAFLTAQLQKDFGKGFFASAAYNFGPSYDLNSGNASTAGSLFTGTPVVGNPNAPVLSYSSSEQLHRFFVSGAYKVEYARNFATGISLFFEGLSGNRFSYTYGGDLNGDNVTGNDLMYIPRDQSEIILVPTNAGDLRTPQQIWEDLNAYIEQDKYLSANRGQYAARNGAQMPWVFRMDLRIFQDFYIETGGKRNTLQFSLDIFNFGNMLNSNWGVIRTPIRSQLLNFVGTETNTGRPIFTYNPTTISRDGVIVERNISFQDAINNFASQWQAQFGVRYIFN